MELPVPTISNTGIPPQRPAGLRSRTTDRPRGSTSASSGASGLPAEGRERSATPFPVRVGRTRPVAGGPSTLSLPLLAVPTRTARTPTLPIFLRILLLPLFSEGGIPTRVWVAMLSNVSNRCRLPASSLFWTPASRHRFLFSGCRRVGPRHFLLSEHKRARRRTQRYLSSPKRPSPPIRRDTVRRSICTWLLPTG